MYKRAVESGGAGSFNQHLGTAYPIGGTKSAITLPVAFLAAESFLEAGSRAYRLLHDEFFEREVRTSVGLDFDRALGFGVPAVANMSFALELFLKVHGAQHTGQYPSGHSITNLYNHLPSNARDRIQRSFANSCREDRFPYLTKFDLMTTTGKGPGDLSFTLVMGDEEQPDPDDPQTMSAIVRMASDLFTVWRYIYERGAGPGQLTVDFFGLNHFIRGVRAEVKSFQGAVTIEVG